jgi:hypothetical protein
MYQPARLFASVILASTLIHPMAAQVNLQPTPPPLVTAENEPWYRSREPIMFAGNLYYPAGAAIHFLANEMVLSAFHQGVPLYSRTTIEPYSVVFVPIAGGMVQPYERRRTGELAGTSGSSVAALPVEIATGTSPIAVALQAAAPPVLGLSIVEGAMAPTRDDGNRLPRVEEESVAAAPTAVSTAGRVASSPTRIPLQIRRGAANGIFVEFNKSRWFNSGPPVTLDARLAQIGEFHGFPVYAARNGGNSTIYIPVAKGMDALAPYSKRK